MPAIFLWRSSLPKIIQNISTICTESLLVPPTMLSRCLNTLQRSHQLTNLCRYSSSKANIDEYINSNISISEEQKRSYTQNGFIIIRNALSQDQLQTWRSVIDTAVNARGDDHVFPVKGQMDTVNAEFEYYKNVFVQRVEYFIKKQHNQYNILYNFKHISS